VAEFAVKAKSQKHRDFLMTSIPNTFVDAFAKGASLQVLLIAILFGVGLSALGSRGKPVLPSSKTVSMCSPHRAHHHESAPIGAFGAMAFHHR